MLSDSVANLIRCRNQEHTLCLLDAAMSEIVPYADSLALMYEVFLATADRVFEPVYGPPDHRNNWYAE